MRFRADCRLSICFARIGRGLVTAPAAGLANGRHQHNAESGKRLNDDSGNDAAHRGRVRNGPATEWLGDAFFSEVSTARSVSILDPSPAPEFPPCATCSHYCFLLGVSRWPSRRRPDPVAPYAVKVPGAEAIVMIRIDSAGKSFQIGSPENEKDHQPEEIQHKVAFTDDWDMAKFTVMVGQFKAFVSDSCYKTEAEDGEGGSGWND